MKITVTDLVAFAIELEMTASLIIITALRLCSNY
jgi:hypothetical protein